MNRYPEKFWDNGLFFCIEEGVGLNPTSKKVSQPLSRIHKLIDTAVMQQDHVFSNTDTHLKLTKSLVHTRSVR
ncbi:hypothetical protein EFO53_10305 [Lacticaseibacillus rhamnosus]|jgi:hypothetical protein|uniref:Uncharacterized protein n=2 Tax=Lacticaseibacillus rhamnosus TaxID=47715 RepID=A0AB74IFM3_LACRH|nr:hypothetical protein [Lacticaseibacillus rhamnosus]AER63222.1 conserved hypothetical protein [Lacticaseibacillus rhamnosus ATCC 8530]AGP73053.1 Hypothetical protein LOCK908_0369 [Lacticaseibacillus rhamnosus LOCK908]EEN79263.1 hypothetical protein HMPREF0539_2666 [Lacticaseibacillus rhamnosus LMS2-1]ETW67977.1 hypothetical protein N577_009055 [Lacticaseibacillus rhamnosus 2166]KDS82837.1 hypothetical protein LR51B_03490 [Lacticaseibacillus rhamnosus 51B]KRK31258.1 hypothetical protein Q777